MQESISILIVEDEIIIAQDLKELLEEVGYKKVFRARNYQQAEDILMNHSIDLALLDINLNEERSGIDLANYINRQYKIPFIYITSYSDDITLDSVKKTFPSAFLLKPYSRLLLLASIEIALFNYSVKKNAAEAVAEPVSAPLGNETELIVNGNIWVKDNYCFIKVPLDEIWWFESDKNYVEIKTASKKYLIRSSLKKLLDKLPEKDFVKCYKQFIINISHVDSFNSNEVMIKGNSIPVSRGSLDEVLLMLK